MDITTIVVPVDGSPHADRAVELAADMAGKYDARLCLVHVLLHGYVPEDIRALSDKSDDEPGRPGMAIGASYVEPELPRSQLLDIGEKLLARAEEQAGKAGIDKVESETVEGPTAQAILEHARKNKADLIIMGSRGLSDLKGLLIGSVSHKVQQLADCNVITVK